MAIIINDNLKNRSPKPLEADSIVQSISDLYNLDYIFDGRIVFVRDEDFDYRYKAISAQWFPVNAFGDVDGGYF